MNRTWTWTEDWLAVLLGGIVLGIVLLATWAGRAPEYAELRARLEQLDEQRARGRAVEATTSSTGASSGHAETEKQWKEIRGKLYRSLAEPWVPKVGGWKADPREAFFSKGQFIGGRLVVLFAATAVLFAAGMAFLGVSVWRFLVGFGVVFLLSVVAFVIAEQELVKYYGLEYPLWALLLGIFISNVFGRVGWLQPALRGELYIKTGLVLLGAEILLSRLFLLGIPGICVSWLVTPVVLIGTYLFGQWVLRIPSRSLNMVISADMSVCGVSAAIATAAACRAKKEELSLAISISLLFTTIMMVAMPAFIRWVGMSEVVGGAWIGGTIDSTGAVVAAGALVGPTAQEVAATVKMIQNALIGVIAFGVSLYWVTYVERDGGSRPAVAEIWVRFPKFILGFLGASFVFSAIHSMGLGAQVLAETAASGTGASFRGWLFCMAFVCIGLDTNFRDLSRYIQGGRPVVLYVCGQAFNLALTFAMAWLMFERVFGAGLAR